MPYARRWEVMMKTMITGATHNTLIIFAILAFFHRPMAEVPTQQEDLGQGAQSLSSFGPRIISLVFCIYSICPNVLSPFAVLLCILFWLHCMYTCLPQQQRLLVVACS